MQAAAKGAADLPRRVAARLLGVRTPQAVAMRLRRARERERRNAERGAVEHAMFRLLRRPRRRVLRSFDPSGIDLIYARP